MKLPCVFHQAFSSSTCSCSSRSSAIAIFPSLVSGQLAFYGFHQPVHGMDGGFLLSEVLDLHDIVPEFVLAGDHRHAKALSVGVGHLLRQLRRLEINLGIDSGSAQLPA